MIKIVKNRNCGEEIVFAESELKLFLGKYDEVIAAEDTEGNEKFISLGDTEIAREYGVLRYLEGLNDYGFYIKTVNRGYCIVSPTEKGVRFGIYSLLKEICLLEIYAEDEIYSDDELDWKEVELKEEPSFDFYDSSWLGWNKYSVEFAKRRRLRIAPFINSYHSFFEMMPKSKYLDEHRDWYSENYTQLCMTNEEMIAEFIRNSLDLIDKKAFKTGNTSCLMVGQEDSGEYCQCARCKKSYEKYGVSGTLIRFVNQVAKAVNEYVNNKYVGKTVKTVTFAYGTTENPPVDENNRPVDSSVMLEKNVVIMTAPITSDFAKPLYDEKFNAAASRSFKGFAALGAEIYMWAYNSVFDDQLMYFGQWDVLRENLEFYKKINAQYMIDMGNPLPDVSFDALTTYVRTSLAWNLNLDEKRLIDDFFAAYYKETAPYVRRYFDESNEWQRKKNIKYTLYAQQSLECKTAEYWDFEKVKEWAELLRQGENAAGSKKIALRVTAQKLTPLYMLLEIFIDKFSKEQLRELIGEFEKAARETFVLYTEETGIQYMRDIRNKLVKWRSLLLP